MEVYDYKESKYETMFKYQRDLLEIGQLTELLIPRNKLILSSINSDLTQIYNVAGSTIGIGGTLVAVLLLVVAMKWWCTHWLGRRAARSKAVIQPTTTEAAPRPSAPVVEYAVK